MRLDGIWSPCRGGNRDLSPSGFCAPARLGFPVVATVAARAIMTHSGLRVIAHVDDCGTEFYAITVERRLKHPAALAITQHAYTSLFA